MKVYLPRNPEDKVVGITSPEEFVSFYSEVYAYANWGHFDDEERVMKILVDGIKNSDDVAAIMRWKTGGRWTTDNEGVLETLRKHVPSTVEGAKALAEDLRTHDRIGPVHALAFLYVGSKGKWPIYDQYAHKGLIAIREGLEPDPECSASGKRGKACVALAAQFSGDRMNWFDQYVANYVSYLTKGLDGVVPAEPEGENADLLRYLADNYTKTRDVDRALWAYGHLFS